MDANLNKATSIKITQTIANLEKNGIKSVYVPTKQEALALLKTMLIPGETIAVGGSVTLFEMGAIDLLKSPEYKFIDRYDKSVTREVIVERLRQGLNADTFLMSSNAITETGLLYNVDGTGNRVAALTFGPKRVIIFAGCNKIVPTLRDAVVRVKNTACPANAIRLDRDAYCAKHGHCMNPSCDPESFMHLSAGACKDCLCRTAVITGNQVNNNNRITVVIIGEELGY